MEAVDKAEEIVINRKEAQEKRYESYEKYKDSIVVTRTAIGYKVTNTFKNTCYLVTKNNGTVKCTCPDYLNRCQPWAIHCKHIIAVARQAKKLTPPAIKPEVTELEKILTRNFPKEQIRERPGRGGKTLRYIGTYSVVQRLNKAFSYQWNWEIVSSKIGADYVFCHGRLTAKVDDVIVVKESFGGKNIQKNSLMGDDLKAAASDALKKAASLLGIGVYLYKE